MLIEHVFQLRPKPGVDLATVPELAPRALALGRGRGFVIPEDIRELAVPVLAHRVVARTEGERLGQGSRDAVRALLAELPPPRG